TGDDFALGALWRGCRPGDAFHRWGTSAGLVFLSAPVVLAWHCRRCRLRCAVMVAGPHPFPRACLATDEPHRSSWKVAAARQSLPIFARSSIRGGLSLAEWNSVVRQTGSLRYAGYFAALLFIML